MSDRLSGTCPRCGAPLPEQAAFCPHCAQTLRAQRELRAPSVGWKRALFRAGVAAAAAAGALAVFFLLQPRTYDALGQLTYTDDDGTYQLLLAASNDRFTPQGEIVHQAERDMEYRMPSRLFINHVDTGVNAGQAFLQKAESVSTQIIQPEGSPSPMACTQPEYMDFSPEAALVSLVDYTGRSENAQLLWTIRMENGDTIRLRQNIALDPIQTLDYHYQDYPMGTAEELQALVDQITQEVPMPTVVNLHLPPVTYGGGLTIRDRPINLYGSEEGGRRTTFTDTVLVSAQDGPILYFYDLDFVGDGTGVGVSASARFWGENCSFTGWRTGVLGYGAVWVNVIGCFFQDNEVGFHFNSDGLYASHSMFNDNTFLNNGTAVLLEQVPTDTALNFQGSRFTGNGVDIDNRCGQPLDISQAIFQ